MDTSSFEAPPKSAEGHAPQFLGCESDRSVVVVVGN
ncbi:hypothetical protein BN1263170274 [Stenotrophomonas indicatrix]|nr:protein of unknown function [Stenotrophomonas maltophilia]CRD48638.1 hypothetical protein BN1263170274 [Stenotrophomonas indicatrix]